MKKLFQATLLVISCIPLFGANEWLYYKHFPWVYDHQSKEWIYLSGSADGKIYVYRASTKEWVEFSATALSSYTDKKWYEQYEEWVKNPEPYGGLETLELIKDAKDYDRTELDLWNRQIKDLTPLSGLTSLEILNLHYNPISDISPLSGLSNLRELSLGGMMKTNPRREDAEIKDLSPLKSLSKLEGLYFGHQPVSDLSPLVNLNELKNLELSLGNVSDLSPLEGLTKLTYLNLSSNSVTDILPLANLTQLENLSLSEGATSGNKWGSGNNISDSQKTMLESALPNTSISW
jgi:Leucine-rich repeat (LRR) protein